MVLEAKFSVMLRLCHADPRLRYVRNNHRDFSGRWQLVHTWTISAFPSELGLWFRPFRRQGWGVQWNAFVAGFRLSS